MLKYLVSIPLCDMSSAHKYFPLCSSQWFLAVCQGLHLSDSSIWMDFTVSYSGELPLAFFFNLLYISLSAYILLVLSYDSLIVLIMLYEACLQFSMITNLIVKITLNFVNECKVGLTLVTFSIYFSALMFRNYDCMNGLHMEDMEPRSMY